MKSNDIKYIGNVGGGTTQSRSVYDPNGVCPTLMAGMTHGNTIPFIIEEDINEIERIGFHGQWNWKASK